MDANVAAALADVKAVITEMAEAIGPWRSFIPESVSAELTDAVSNLEAVIG